MLVRDEISCSQAPASVRSQALAWDGNKNMWNASFGDEGPAVKPEQKRLERLWPSLPESDR